MAQKTQNITGKTFNRLTALRFFERRKKYDYWLFKCTCGNEVVYRKCSVTSVKGKTKSCGCLNRENTIAKGKANRTHGMSTTKFYYIWMTMKNRCENSKVERYKYYGARGIKVVWKSFEDFMNDMYESYEQHQKEHPDYTSIDRIDVNGNYCKENCRWATRIEQANNKRINYA